MGLFNSIKDHFTTDDFCVVPQKKVGTICKEFKKTFGCTLAIYKGARLADSDMTLAQLNKVTSKNVVNFSELHIRASMKVGDVERQFDQLCGLTVQIKDPTGKVCVDNNLTIGEASRGKK